MDREKGLGIMVVVLLASLALAGAGWTACTSVEYSCDNYDAVRGICSDSTRSGIYGRNDGEGWGVFGRTSTSDSSAVQAGVGGENLGNGPGVYGHSSKGPGVYGVSESISSAGIEGKNLKAGVAIQGFTTSAPPSSYPAIQGHNYGAGPGISGSSSSGEGVQAFSNLGPGVKAGSSNGFAGYFELNNKTNTKWALVGKNLYGTGVYGEGKSSGVYGKATTYGVRGVSVSGNGGYFNNTGAGATKAALKAQTSGIGYAAEFRAPNVLAKGGIYIKTNGAKGIVVDGGTKNAAVDTSQGKRALYAEEACEVYFIDYGFGKLKDGKASIPIDPVFAETVNLEQDYFVFVQPYARAELFVSQTTPAAFEVSLNNGDPNARFAYRLVAKRKGFETARLEAVSCPPERDYAEKPATEAGALSLAQAQQE